MSEEEDTFLLEDSEYSRKSEFSKATLAQTQVQKCLELRSKDMSPGYTTWVLDKDGNAKPQIIPDSRKEFVSAVTALRFLLNPEISLDKNKDMLTDYEKRKQETFEKFCYQERKYRKFITKDGKTTAVWVCGDRKYIPQKGASILTYENINGLQTKMAKGIWDEKIDAYWDEMVELADELFAKLNDLIHSLDYFKGGTSF